MVAPAMEALLASRTLPRMVPDADCAHREGAIDKAKIAEMSQDERIDTTPSPLFDDYIPVWIAAIKLQPARLCREWPDAVPPSPRANLRGAPATSRAPGWRTRSLPWRRYRCRSRRRRRSRSAAGTPPGAP